jgi:transcriptional regulator with XRE-family HTH domain
MRSPISASVSLAMARRSVTRDAHVVMGPSLRDPVAELQRDPVTAFRDACVMPKPTDLPSFKTLGERIVYWREKRGWDRRELARRAKIPYSTLAGIEEGEQKTSTKTPQIATALGLNSLYLATDKGDPEAGATVLVEDEWPFPFPRETLVDLDPNELELAGLKFQKIIEEIRANRPKQRTRKTG